LLGNLLERRFKMGRFPVPSRLKRYLVPVWNEAHRLGWALREYGGAIVRGRLEHCTVCGRFRPMIYRHRVVPRRLVELWGLSGRLAKALARKESGDCSYCGAQLRARRMALVIMETYPVGHRPSPARSLAEWASSPLARGLRIAEINRIEGLHERLASLPELQFSDYEPGAASGAVIRGVRSEDLTRLTYPDESFDLVLTSETLEHVPCLTAALSEIHRILRPGGRHIFTIPLLPGVPKTFARTVVRPDGTHDLRAPQVRHPGGDVGYPVFTEFGADLPELLRAAGFEVTVHFGPTTEDDLAQVYLCRKVEREPAVTTSSQATPAEG
jgi:SAM-dependent methyltransferase